ncbi:replication-associated recombination protein A [Algimonas porphyrae]|uniref:Replication-associated recombination protein A n=1 Tax=Algimonas porphyrae TaxID=1128113 RepID=A0ABQ5V0Y5_9PROT|nr:replication-associated recombination protein A [Algimonas porphyrae]GLQ21213.1 ATPase AAA [Algimonas porphyrae]
MTSLFESAGLSDGAPLPLAERLRPQTLDDVIGQDHLLGPEGPIGRMLAQDRLSSCILWGPPGVGKTTIARLLAGRAGLEFVALSAVFSGVGDLRKVFDAAKARRETGQGTLLFVDEIHRFNKAQQDGFLPFVEAGTVTLVGATTENPSFELNAALLSRCQVFVLNRLDADALDGLLARAEKELGRALPLTQDARAQLVDFADGDGRYLLTLADEVFAQKAELDAASLSKLLQKRAPVYDKSGEAHYNLISALHKSMRGSDPDAALYWLARMIAGGEDPRYIARRVIRFASEDIGAADPVALMISMEAARSYERLGSPEGELAIAQAVLHCASAPKSNAVYTAWKAALRLAKETGSVAPPKNILNAPTKMMKSLGYGAGYEYDHDSDDGFSGADYWPDEMDRVTLYAPKDAGRERAIAERMARWADLRAAKRGN